MKRQVNVTRKELIHKGKVNNVYSTSSPDYLELEATDKNFANNQISSAIFKYLEENGIPTHFVCGGSNPASKIVRATEMIPLKVICRFVAAGSFCKRYECSEGKVFKEPFIEFIYKSNNAGEQPIDRKTILALPEKTLIGDEKELELIEYYTAKSGELISEFYANLDVELIDFKVEFGHSSYGQIVLCDEISPDTCRLIDIKTGEELDKDYFSQKLGNISKGYEAILKRVMAG